MKPFGKGIYWTILILIFGLLQLWFSVFYVFYEDPSAFSFYPLVKDGALLFFSLAVVVGITIDYHFDERKSKVGGLSKATAFVFFPLIVVTMIVAGYMTISTSTSDNEEVIKILNYSSLSLTILYAILGKTYLFLNSKT